MVDCSPSLLIFDNTFFTKSGRDWAFEIIFFLAKSLSNLSVPDDIRDNIIAQFDNDPKGDMRKVFDYFIKNRMMMLMEELDGFKEPKYKSYAQDVMNLA